MKRNNVWIFVSITVFLLLVVMTLSIACFFQWRHSAGLKARVDALQAELARGRQRQATTTSATATVQQLHLAAYRGDLTQLRSLLDAHPEWLNAKAENRFNNTALHFAAYYGQEEVVAELIKRGAEVNAQNRNGNTPLHDAITSGNPAVIKLLLKSGADASVRNSAGKDPLQQAATDSPEIAEIIRQFRAESKG
jgi:hypothetical protein